MGEDDAESAWRLPVPAAAGAAARLAAAPGSASHYKPDTAILLAPLTLVALVVVLFSGHAADQCNSGIGQLAQGFSTRAFHDCTTANLVHIISIVVLVVAGVGCAAAFITHIAGGHRPPPYPTWPPMQDMPPAPPPRVGPGVAPQRPPWSPPPAS